MIRVVGRSHEVELAYVSPDDAQHVADTMRALATPSRVRILSRLAAAPSSVGQLASDLDLEQSTVSQQLRVLRHLRLVVGQRRGRQIIYELHDDHVGVLLAQALSHTEHLGLRTAKPVRQRAVAG
jgi:DNA-binding transcriptional ArsR family regulator